LAFLRTNYENLAVFWWFGGPFLSIFEHLTEFFPNLYVVPHSGI